MAGRRPPSIRYGLRPEVQPLAKDALSDDLRVDLWNAIFEAIPEDLQVLVWTRTLRLPADDFNKFHMNDKLKQRVLKNTDVALVLDTIEDVSLLFEYVADATDWKRLLGMSNAAFREHMSCWRFLPDGTLFPSTSEEEVQEISRALDTVEAHPRLAGSRTHLKGAIAQLKANHYPKAAGEAMLAMESFARAVTDEKGTLGQLTSKLMAKAGLSKAVGNSIGALYGWSSEDGGMRHGLNVGDEPADEPEARFLIVTVSAYINLLTTKLLKKGVKL